MTTTSTVEEHCVTVLSCGGYFAGTVHYWHCRWCGTSWQVTSDTHEPTGIAPHVCSYSRV